MKRTIILICALAALALSNCARKPAPLKTPAAPELNEAVTDFYNFLLHKDIDSFADKNEMQSRFQDQDKFYTFLDTILPAMWERNFERNRINEYSVLAMDLNADQSEAWVKVWIKSDDSLPFGKVMTFSQRWYIYKATWFPAQIKAPKATPLEKYR